MKNSSDINALFLLQEKVAALRAASAIQLCRRAQSVSTVQRNQARLLPNFTTVLFTVCGRNASSTGHSPSMAAVLVLCWFMTHNMQLKLASFALMLFLTGFLCHQSELMMSNSIIKESILSKKFAPVFSWELLTLPVAFAVVYPNCDSPWGHISIGCAFSQVLSDLVMAASISSCSYYIESCVTAEQIVYICYLGLWGEYL